MTVVILHILVGLLLETGRKLMNNLVQILRSGGLPVQCSHEMNFLAKITSYNIFPRLRVFRAS